MARFSLWLSYVVVALAIAVIAPEVAGIAQQTAALAALGFLVMALAVDGAVKGASDRRRLQRQVAELDRAIDGIEKEFADLEADFEALSTTIAKAAESSHNELQSEFQVLKTLMSQVVNERSHEPQPAAAGIAGTVGPATPGTPPEADETVIFEIMRHALADNRIDLYLQPIVALPSRRSLHYECFSRVRDETGRVIFPSEFLPVAEESGLAGTLDNLILFRCVRVIRRLGKRRPKVKFFCNLSPVSLRDDEFFPQFVDYMRSQHDLAQRLVFEFRQSDLEEMDGPVLEKLSALAKRGFCFSMDHVSDLALDPKWLSDHAIRYVKVDASALRSGAGDIDPRDLKRLLSRHGIALIVSRIEDENAVVNVLDFDVEYGQGYLFSEPRLAREETAADAPPLQAAIA